MLFAGDGANQFAIEAGFEPADPDEMITDLARRHLADVLEQRAAGVVGEAILRACLAYSTCLLMREGLPAPDAARSALARFETRFGGSGGLIVVDYDGRVGAKTTTAHMSHAVARSGERVVGGA